MKRKMNLAIVVSAMIVACAGGFVNNSYKSLSVSKEAYTGSLSILGDLYKQGQVGEDVKKQAIELGRAYQFAHNEAVSALLAYQSSGAATDKQRSLETMARVSASLSKLLDFVRPYLKED